MTTNMGQLDRILRIIVGIALLVFAFISPLPYAWVGYFGVVPLATAALGWCPAYSMIGLSTCSK